MPVGVVKSPEDERHWGKAKALAAKQGRAKDWAYIMGIYQKMSGKSVDAAEKCLAKSTTAALSPMFILTKWPGQVPTRENIDLLRQTKQMPSPPTMAQLLSPGGAYLTPASVIDGLGLDRSKANEWRELLGKALNSRNELTVRHELVSKMLADRMAPELRRALFSRALSYYRDMRKSMVQVVTADELRKGGGEGSRGGNVIGHTTGGAPIYAKSHGEMRHQHLQALDAARAAGHHDVANAHNDAARAHQRALHLPRDANYQRPKASEAAHSAWDATQRAEALGKSNGEGSRGGHVIGHAAGGKPVYDSKKTPWPGEQQEAAARQKHFESQWVSPTGKIGTMSKAEQPGAIVDQGEQGDPDVRLERVIRVVCHRLGNAGPEGLSLDKLSDVIKTYGQPLVAKALNKACAQGGSMTFKKGLLQLRSV